MSEVRRQMTTDAVDGLEPNVGALLDASAQGPEVVRELLRSQIQAAFAPNQDREALQ